MDESLKEVSEKGNIDGLYALIGRDPNILERIDKIPFAETPLHTAASFGRTHFAIEVLSLMPSFGRKLNPDGLSPMHLALKKLAGRREQANSAVPADPDDQADPADRAELGEHGAPADHAGMAVHAGPIEGAELGEHASPANPAKIAVQTHTVDCTELAKTVRRLIKFDSELIRVQGRERKTPLHYVAEKDDCDLLDEFLRACPSSIQDLTSQGETAVHIAVRNKKVEALKILLRWLQWDDKEEVLKWKDEEGNNVLHIAAETNQLQAVTLLIKKVDINAINSKRLTALDLVFGSPSNDDMTGRVKDILLKNKAKKGSAIGTSKVNIPGVNTLLPYLVILGRFIWGLPTELSKERRDTLVVVAVLIATATYQAALQPAGGLWQADPSGNQPPPIPTATGSLTSDKNRPSSLVGKVVMNTIPFSVFFLFNTFAFCASIGVLFLSMTGLKLRNTVMLMMALLFLLASYIFSMTFIAPGVQSVVIMGFILLLCAIVVIVEACVISWPQLIDLRKARRRLAA